VTMNLTIIDGQSEPTRIGREPVQKPGKSRQDYGTSPLLLAAVARQFGPIDFDLAAREDNKVAADFYSPEQDSLKQDWSLPGVRVAWLNPPFADIDPWAAKLAECRSLPRWTLMLVPASIDAQWYVNHVLGNAMVWGIPRVTFVGETSPYPKALCVIGAGFNVSGHGYWRWR
jgi:phage N-6-adenine-methyltransferase